MVTTVEALPAAEFQTWLERGAAGGDALAQGAELAQQQGCLGCHSVDGSRRVGPTFKGLAGSPRLVSRAGQELTVTADAAYLTRAIRDPAAEIVAGYPPVMPPYAGLAETEVAALIAWMESLH
jgi:cytochrome c oxidase subunit 2